MAKTKIEHAAGCKGNRRCTCRPCGSRTCSTRFVPVVDWQKCCSRRCTDRENQALYHDRYREFRKQERAQMTAEAEAARSARSRHPPAKPVKRRHRSPTDGCRVNPRSGERTPQRIER